MPAATPNLRPLSQAEAVLALSGHAWMPGQREADASRAAPLLHMMEFNLDGGLRWARMARADHIGDAPAAGAGLAGRRSLRLAMDWLSRVEMATQSPGWAAKEGISQAWIDAADLCRGAASEAMRSCGLEWGSAIPVDWAARRGGWGRRPRLGAAVDFRGVRAPAGRSAAEALAMAKASFDARFGEADWFEAREPKASVRIEDCEGPAAWLRALRDSHAMKEELGAGPAEIAGAAQAARPRL